MQKTIKFLDNHRFILVIIILFIISLLFFSIKTYLFFHHDFEVRTCSSPLDSEYCYYEDLIILKNPEEYKEKFFLKYKDEISTLKENYNLDEFNHYTAYYYDVAAHLQYEISQEYKVLSNFFKAYTNTYDLENFYLENNFYFNIFYHYNIQ